MSMSKWRQKANAMAEVAEEEEEIQKRVWATFRGRALQTNHHHYPITLEAWEEPAVPEFRFH